MIRINRKLGIFVSSTYKDLIDERNTVSKAILAAGHIPMGMELFTPNGKTTSDVIKSTIDNCDYLLLIIAGMYGSTYVDSGEEKSYTEMEYDYAVSQGKPVLLFFHEDITSLPAKKVEQSSKKRKLLNKFLNKVKKSNVLGIGWNGLFDLDTKANISLGKLINDADDSLGWIRVKDIDVAPENTTTVFFFTQEKRPQYSLFTHLAKDTKEIRVFLKTGVTLFSSYKKQLIQEINNGCIFSFITPEKQFVSARGGQKDLDLYKVNFENVKQHLMKMYNEVQDTSRFVVKTVEYIPSTGIVYFKKKDGNEYLLIQEYFVSSRTGRDRPMFLLKKDDPWFDAYYEELMEMDKEGRERHLCEL